MLGTLAVGACVTVGPEAPTAASLQPSTNVTSRFSADYESEHGGTITFQTIQGTYNGSCGNPAGSGDFSAGTEWYVPIGGYAGTPTDWNGSPMTGLQLALVEDGSASCVLTVQALSYTCASCGGTSYTSAASPPIPLGAMFASSPAAFAPPSLPGSQNRESEPFYANFFISATAPWSASPTISILLSDNPGETASYATYNGGTSLTYAAPPDYTVNVGSTTAAVTVDQTETVVTVSGGLFLSYGSVPASSAAGCVYTTTEPTQTNAGIVAAFESGTPCPTSGDQSWASPFYSMFIDASNFVSVGDTLPETAYILFQNTSSGVSSYEQVAFTFNAAP